MPLRDVQPRGHTAAGAKLQDAKAGQLSRRALQHHAAVLEGKAGGQTHIRVPEECPGRLLHRHREAIPRIVLQWQKDTEAKHICRKVNRNKMCLRKAPMQHNPSFSITRLWSPGTGNSSNKRIIVHLAEWSIELLQCSCKSSWSLGPYRSVNTV